MANGDSERGGANEATGLPPPGWYADPDGSPRSRWWDGSGWTWQVASAGTVEWAAPPATAVVPAPTYRSLGVALGAFATGVALGVAIMFVLSRVGKPGGAPVQLGLSELGLWAGFVGGVMLVSRRRGSGSLRTDFFLAARPIDLAFGFAGSLAGRAMAIAAVTPFAGLLVNQHKSVDQQTFRSLIHSSAGWTVLVLVTCVGAPIVEELFFRGLIQTRLVARWGAVTGIGVTSLLFGAAHLIGWSGPISLLYAWSIAAAGVTLGTLRHLTGRLGTSMVAHALFNAQAMALLAAFALIR